MMFIDTHLILPWIKLEPHMALNIEVSGATRSYVNGSHERNWITVEILVQQESIQNTVYWDRDIELLSQNTEHF